VLQRIQLRDDEEGVSEVVGSILTLIVTVSLFSSIFIGVQSLQAPEGGNHIDFSATFEKNNNYYINITNDGDGSLSSECSINIVDEDGVSHPYSFSDDSSGNDFNDGEWNLGDTLNLKFSGSEKDIFEDSKSVELVIIDNRKSRVVWRDTVKTGDILAPIIQDYGVDYPLEWESYTLPGEKVTLWTDVIDKDTTGPLNVSVDLHKLEGQYNNNNLEPTGRYKQKETNRYKLNLKIHDEQDNGTYLLKLNASDDNGNQNTESYYFVLHIGRFAEAEDANLIVDPNNFISTPDTPQNGQGYSLTATVYNDGGRKAVADIEFWDQHPDGKSYLIDTVEDVSFPVGGGRNIQSDWIVNDSGTHKITVNATNPSNGRAGEGSINITVSPTILVVDDASTNGPRSERKTMINALEASDFEYELYEVNGGDGPAYNTGPNPLEEYDIVIWLTGSKTSNTLTQNDEDNLELFLEDNRKLWLIGDGIEEQSTAASWVSSNLNVDFKQSNEVPQSPLIGNEIPFKSDGKFHLDESLAGRSDRISSLHDANESLVDSTQNEYCYMVSNKSDKPGGVRTVFQSFLFSSLNEKITGSRTRLAYKVIMWLGNMSKRSGIDLAISSQETSDLAPKYMDNLNISATVRNNGQENITTEAVLEVDGSIIKTNQSIVVGAEDTTGISFNWLADELGEHELKIIVDPFDKIDETNEINNDVSYQGDVPVINVEFTTLIVDDDGKDGGEGSDNSTYYVENAYKSLGYTYEMFYANSSGTDSEVAGPDVDKMSYYNAICWVAGSGNDPFYEEKGINVDIENITSYLGQYESNFIIIGDRALQNIPEGFRSDKLRVKQNSVDDEDSPPHLLNGIKNDPITHGFEYRLKESISDKPYHYNLLDEADPILNSSQDNTEYTYAHRYQNETSNYKITYLGVDPIHFKQAYSEDESEWYKELDYDLTGKSMREELFFKINQWFGKYDDRIELRASDIDVKVSSKHPTLVMGSSFVIRAKIQNMGGTGADALIRFKDGHTHIATESMYVPAHSLKTVEVKWKPVNAGEDRPIRVIVDPLRELGEIPNDPGNNNKEDHLGFNNQAITYSDVFYFWDDMENGTRNWRHQSNLAMINGEVPIDYMGGQYKSLDTDISSSWDYNKSVEKISWDSHSNPNSYFMEETKGLLEGKADAFVAIVIDGSRSMSNRTNSTGKTYFEAAVEGARKLINTLSNESVVTLVTYQGDNAVIKQVGGSDYTKLDSETNRSGINETLNDWTAPGGHTPLWDSIGKGYTTINDSDIYKDLSRAVVALTDGCDLGASDTSENVEQLEDGSEEWAPWHNMEDGTKTYSQHQGKYTIPFGTELGEWKTVPLNGPGSTRKGLLNSDVPIFNIGLGLEHHSPPNANGVSSYPGDDVVDSNTHILGTESGTVEYNLWRTSTTSDAKYFYSPSGDDLEKTFAKIGGLLAQPGNLSSVNYDEKSIKSWDNPNPSKEENTDKWAVTHPINIKNMSSAYLTFWQKYKLLNGVNGGFLELNYSINGDWKGWKYTKPSIGPYSGNLYLDGKLPKDEHNNTIRWCWNGRSNDGTLDWEYVRVDLFRHIPENADEVKVRFYYKQYGGANEPGGWLIDDVNIIASRKPNVMMSHDQMDRWRDVKTIGPNGKETTAWWNGIDYNTPNERFKGGIDNRLITRSIDLTNAQTAKLSADFKFNINSDSGRPPDGFRVEVTTDNGVTWQSINLGSRAASGVSNGWIHSEIGSNPLNRLLLDISDFSGETIQLRFRVVTNNVQQHYDKDPQTAGYGGLYIDNVVISGHTI